MLKYYVCLFLAAAVALFYAFTMDPCNRLLTTDFSDKHPGYKILGTGASEGTPESVRCHISYRKPEREEIYEDIWLYQYSGGEWEFSSVIESRKKEELDESHDERPRNGERTASAAARLPSPPQEPARIDS